MSEAVTVPSLIMMTLIVSEELLARRIHTDTDTPHTHTLVSFMLTFSTVFREHLKTKSKQNRKKRQTKHIGEICQ